MTDLEAYAASFLEVRPRPSPVKWAEANLTLSPRITENPGPYSTRLHPYVREVLDAIADPTVKRISLCWGSQTSKTTTFYVSLAWVICQDNPKAILWVFPNVLLCKAFAAERWLPFCRDAPPLAEQIPKDLKGDEDTDRFNLTKQEFARSTMHLVGAGSSANVRSYPVSALCLDEIDVIPSATRRECLDRIKGRHDYKILQSSTPIEKTGGIWDEFQTGDRRRFYLPCPECDAQIVLRLWDDKGELNLRWDPKAKLEGGGYDLGRVQSTTVYVCENCQAELKDHHKLRMLKRGKWVAGSTTAEAGFRSYHLNSLYSPTITFGRAAVEYLKSSLDPGALSTFVNGWLAEPYQQQESKIDPERFKALEGDYERGEARGQYRIIGVDVQRSTFFWVVRGFEPDGTSYLIDHGTAPTFDDLETLAENYGASYGCVDSGFRTQEIYEEVHARRPFWFAIKGWDRLQTSYRMSQLDPFAANQTKQVSGAEINLLHVNSGTWKAELVKRRNGERKDWFVYREVDGDYTRQMLSTNLVEKVDKRGRVILDWQVEGHRQDHYFDCETYILCLSHVFGLGGSIIRKEKGPKKRPAKKAPKRQRPRSGFWKK